MIFEKLMDCLDDGIKWHSKLLRGMRMKRIKNDALGMFV